jgi:hypothetical protein
MTRASDKDVAELELETWTGNGGPNYDRFTVKAKLGLPQASAEMQPTRLTQACKILGTQRHISFMKQ